MTSIDSLLKLAIMNCLIVSALLFSVTFNLPVVLAPFPDDIAIASVSGPETTIVAAPYNVASYNVTLLNNGNSFENVSVTLSVGAQIVSGATVSGLAPGAFASAIVTWDSSTFTFGTYTLIANATLQGRVDQTPSDNSIPIAITKGYLDIAWTPQIYAHEFRNNGQNIYVAYSITWTDNSYGTFNITRLSSLMRLTNDPYQYSQTFVLFYHGLQTLPGKTFTFNFNQTFGNLAGYADGTIVWGCITGAGPGPPLGGTCGPGLEWPLTFSIPVGLWTANGLQPTNQSFTLHDPSLDNNPSNNQPVSFGYSVYPWDGGGGGFRTLKLLY